MLDVIFLSYNEPNADINYQRLLKFAPHAKRVSGVKGILEAHQAAARKSMTNHFYVVDADAWIVDEFDFSYTPSISELVYKRIPSIDCVFCWASKNPINNLIYGYGGVKLFRKDLLLAVKEWRVDLSTSMGAEFVSKDQISNITVFNTDPFSTWRSAFRECTKLASGIISDDTVTKQRLDIWCSTATGNYAHDALAGAHAGRQYGTENKGNLSALAMINDFEWLYDRFRQHYTNN